MKQTINESDFHAEFHRMARSDQYTYEARQLIFNHLHDYEEQTGEEIELDVVGICCEICEESPREIAENYSIDISDIDPEDDKAIAEAVGDYLDYHTTVIGQTKSGDIVYYVF